MPVCQQTSSSGFANSTSTSTSQSNPHRVSAPTIAGIVLGVVLTVVLLAGAIIFKLLSRRRHRQASVECFENDQFKAYPVEIDGHERCEVGWTKTIPLPMKQDSLPNITTIELSAEEIEIAELQSPVLGSLPEMPDSGKIPLAGRQSEQWGDGRGSSGTLNSNPSFVNRKRHSVPLPPRLSHQKPRPFSHPETKVPPPYSEVASCFQTPQDDRITHSVMMSTPPSSSSGPQEQVNHDGRWKNVSTSRNMGAKACDFALAYSDLNNHLFDQRTRFTPPVRNTSVSQSASVVLTTRSPQIPFGQSPVSPLQPVPLGETGHSASNPPMFDMASHWLDTPPPSAGLLSSFRPHRNVYTDISPLDTLSSPPEPSGSFVEPSWLPNRWGTAEGPRTMPTSVSSSMTPISPLGESYIGLQ